MNKVILMGRLTKMPEMRYSQSMDPIAITRYTLAVNRRYKKDGKQEADFINILCFGKAAEFANKYFKKGQMVSVVGRLQVRAWEDEGATKHWTTEVIAEEQYFAESKSSYESHRGKENEVEGFYPVNEEELPF